MRLNCVPNTGETTIITIPSTERLSDFLQVTELVDCGAWIQTWAVRLHRWFVLLPSGGKGWGGGKKACCCCCCCQVASVVSNSVRPHRRHLTRLPRPWDSPGKNTGVGCHFLLQHMKMKSETELAQSCPTLSDPMDFSLPGSSVHGIFQARVLEWDAIAFSERKPRGL